MQALNSVIQKVSQICFSFSLTPAAYYVMGNIVESLAFIPPDRMEAHHRMKNENASNFHSVKNALGNSVAILWFNFDAEYTILYSHGNAEDLAGSKTTFLEMATFLECNYCAYDYSGYGLSEGQCSEKAAFADVESVFKFLTVDQQIPANKIIVFGRSLGSGPTVHLASTQPNLAGMILQSPLRSAIKTQMPDWVGVVFKKIDIFRNEDKIGRIKTFPALIIHGTTDAVVPYSHGKHLYDTMHKSHADPSQVELYSVDGCGHNDIEYRKGRDYRKHLKHWIRRAVMRNSTTTNEDDAGFDYEEDIDDEKLYAEQDKMAFAHPNNETHTFTAPVIDDISFDHNEQIAIEEDAKKTFNLQHNNGNSLKSDT